MKTLTLFICLALAFCFNSYGQENSFIYNLDTSGYITPMTVYQTHDGGWIIGGGTAENGDDKYVAIKLDANGELEWQTMYNNWKNQGYHLCINNDSSYVLVSKSLDYVEEAAEQFHFNGGIMRLDQLGNVIWSKSYGGAPGQGEYGYNFDDKLYNVCVTTGNKIVAVGLSNSYSQIGGNEMPWIICTDQEGNQLWDYYYETPEYWGMFPGVCPTDDGGIIAAGFFVDPDDDNISILYNRALIVKLNENGEVVWEKLWRRNGLPTLIRSITPMNDGNYAICGAAYRCLGDGYDCSPSPIIAVIDDNGEVLWSKTFAYHPIMIESWARDIEVTPDDDIIITGSFNFPTVYNEMSWAFAFIIKVYKTGNILWDKLFGNEEFMSTFFSVCYNKTDSSYSTVGRIQPMDKLPAYPIFLKTDSLGNSELPLNSNYILNSISKAGFNDYFAIYPNPARDYIIIELSGNERNTVVTIFDLFGKEIINTNLNSEHNTIDVSMLKPGVYLVKTQSGLRSKFIKH
ncbi:MAG: T9SS type A sorting domain-containing protein [Bacteroidales bacterium]|nr:T9SS type A sorting domain-containing protein [Bacteroidales bacterium]